MSKKFYNWERGFFQTKFSRTAIFHKNSKKPPVLPEIKKDDPKVVYKEYIKSMENQAGVDVITNTRCDLIVVDIVKNKFQ